MLSLVVRGRVNLSFIFINSVVLSLCLRVAVGAMHAGLIGELLDFYLVCHQSFTNVVCFFPQVSDGGNGGPKCAAFWVSTLDRVELHALIPDYSPHMSFIR